MFDFVWISDPTAWLGLGTLILLEIILGIDNLVFIAILANKLPPEQRDRARLIGLGLAMIMRLVLLAAISWVIGLTATLFTVLGQEISGRDIILIAGGLFLLFKATSELHERLEGGGHGGGPKGQASFMIVIVQILLLDMVFSLDSVITAVVMVDHLMVMMIAVVIAVGVMMIASKPLTRFVSQHPTVIVLCLGFLLMIGLTLVLEGFDIHIPKAYLYAAIGFSILVEAFNQITRGNVERQAIERPALRARAADALVSLMSGDKQDPHAESQLVGLAEGAARQELFAPEERDMIASALALGGREAESVMTPRRDVVWVDLNAAPDQQRETILAAGHSRLPVARGDLDHLEGVARAHDLLRDLIKDGAVNMERSVHAPLMAHETMGAMSLIEQMRSARIQLVVVVDEHGDIEGIITPGDILEAITGVGDDDSAQGGTLTRQEDGSWLADGSTDIHRLSRLLSLPLDREEDDYATLGGFLLEQIGRLPKVGDSVETNGYRFEIASMEERRIGQVRISQAGNDTA